MKKQLKFLLFAILMLTLVMMTMICVSAAADGDTEQADEHYFKVSANKDGSDATYYLTWSAARGAVVENGYIFQLQNYNDTGSSVAAPAVTNVTFDGGNFTFGAKYINFGSAVKFTVKNAIITTTNTYYGFRTNAAGAHLVLEGCTVNAYGAFIHCNKNSTTVDVLGNTNVLTANYNSTAAAAQKRLFSLQAGTTGHVVNIEGGTLNAKGSTVSTINAGCTATFNISGGTITTGTHAFNSNSGVTEGSLQINISGGVIDADAGKYSLISSAVPVALNVTGGKIYVGSQIAYINALSTLNLKGGEFVIASTTTSHGISGGNYDHTLVFGFSAEEKAAAKAEGKTLTDVKITQNSAKNIISLGAGSNGASYTFNGGEFTFAGGTGFYIGTKATLNVLGGTFTYTDTSTTAIVFNYAAAGTVNLKNATFSTKGIVLHANNASITTNVENVSVENAYAVVKTSKGNTVNLGGTIDGGFSYAVEFMTSALATVNVLEGASITTNSATFLVNSATAVGKVIVNDATIVSNYSVFHNLGTLTVEVNDSTITCGDSSVFIATATGTTNATVKNSTLYTNAHLLYNASKTEDVEGEDGSIDTVVTNASTTLSLENSMLIKLDLVTENKDQLVLDDVADGGVTLTIVNFTVLAKKGTMLGADAIIGDYAPAVKFGGNVYYAYMTTEGAAINKAGAEIYMGLDEKGNLVDGIRFTSELSADVIALVKAAVDAGKTVSYGMVIAPADYVVAAGTFTKAALDEAFGSTNGKLDTKSVYVDVPAKNSLRDANNDGVYESFSAMLINIKEANYTRAFAAVGYVVIDGEITYSAYNTLDNARSAQYVATALLESGYFEGESDMIAILNKYAGVAAA